MALITCPDCHKQVSENAEHCPHCGLPVTAELVAAHRQKIEEAKKQEPWYAFGVLGILGVFFLVFCSGVFSGSKSMTTSYPTPAPTPARSANEMPQSEYGRESAHHAELGQKMYPTKEELREYLLLDGRLSVKEGQMSVQDYERYTGQKY